MKTLLLAAALIALSAPARAEQHQCVLYIEQQDQQLHVHNPVCFDSKGDVVVGSADRIMHVSARNENCTTIIEGVERVDSSTYLVRTYCKGRKPERKTLVFQLIDDGDGGTLRITNAESSQDAPAWLTSKYFAGRQAAANTTLSIQGIIRVSLGAIDPRVDGE